MFTALCGGLMDRQHLLLHLLCHFNKYRLEIFHMSCHPLEIKEFSFTILIFIQHWFRKEIRIGTYSIGNPPFL